LNQNFSQQKNSKVKSAISDLNQEFKEREVIERSKELNIGYVNLKKIPINIDFLQLISKEESIKGKIIPFFKVGKKLRVAFSDENNIYTKEIIDGLIEQGFEVNKNLCSMESLSFAQRNFKSKLHFEDQEIIAKEKKIKNYSQEIKTKDYALEIKNLKSDQALNLLHEKVLSLSASDLHLESKKNYLRVRARVDGVLIDLFEIDSSVAEGIIRQIKHEAHLKFNIKNIPQDGKYAFKTSDRKIDVRVSTLPTVFGETIVLRFLDPKKGAVALEKLGFSANSLQNFTSSLQRKNGLILVTGPTGSGKTTTLHSALRKINNKEKKVITLEDPVELQIEGIVQCEINASEGFDFAEGVHAILRQDPDVIMIGEIRDLKTAQAAVQAALTGHLVFSTLHTNSAVDAAIRLLNMGISPIVLAPALRCIVAQRLVRLVCSKCVQFQEPSSAEKLEIEKVLSKISSLEQNLKMPLKIPVEKGCSECSFTGFKGQTSVAEILPINENVRKIIKKETTQKEVISVAEKAGMRTMWEEGILKVIKGETTFSEIYKNIENFT